jgi:tRNA A-37 threonylcarbamoyl transferase component Bud32
MSYYFIKHNVQESESFIHNSIYNLNIINTPKPYTYDNNTKIFTMKNIPTLNLSDMYGENFSDIPTYITDEIRNIIATLYSYGIEYPDITGYNFIEYQNKIWIIDFGHASYKSDYTKYDPFIIKFINGSNNWNPKYI